jgi:hypothetical protein
MSYQAGEYKSNNGEWDLSNNKVNILSYEINVKYLNMRYRD